MFRQSSHETIPGPDRESEPKRRDRGLIEHAHARALWDAAPRNKPCPERRQDLRRFLLLGERPEPVPARRGPIETPGATGICCSGGGIRSAAYNLGVLQALQREGQLQKADYLAAVSGGSYIAAAFCMVGKTWTDAPREDASESDDSDPDLIAGKPAFAPGSPEEQYLRNHSAYLAPGAAAKAYLAFRLVLGLVFNVVFLALPIVGAMLLAGTWIYMPAFHGIPGGDLHVPLAAWLIPVVIASAGVAIGTWRVARRPPNDRYRRFSEIWSIRLLVAAGLVAVLTLALPAIVDMVQGTSDSSRVAFDEGKVGGSGGAGIAGIVAGLLACLREAVSSPKRAAAQFGRARGWLARQNVRLRALLVNTAALIAGPMLMVTIAALALTVTADTYADPDGRLTLTLAAAGALGLFLVLYRVTDLTAWSLHPFYKRRLSTAFALKRVLPSDDWANRHRAGIAQENEEGIAIERDFDRHVSLSQTALSDWPTLIVCAAANISDPGATPVGRRVTSFTFSAHAIGGPLVGGLDTHEFEQAFANMRRGRDFTLLAAVAMSGAALSPSMGKTSKGSWRFLMTLANIRLGVWVPNPRWVSGTEKHQRRHYKRPRPGYLLAELLGRNRVDAKYLYVTDGGHYENLGLVELLRRGCTRIYCFDASGGQTFAELGDAIAIARSELGVEIDIDPTPLTPAGEPPTAETDVVTGTLRYRSGETGVLVYARNVMTPTAAWDVRSHQRVDPPFPHDPTTDQLYTDQKFEAYRALGETAGGHAVALMEACSPQPPSVAAMVLGVPA